MYRVWRELYIIFASGFHKRSLVTLIFLKPHPYYSPLIWQFDDPSNFGVSLRRLIARLLALNFNFHPICSIIIDVPLSMSNYLSTRLKTPVILTDGTIRRLQGGSPHLRQSWRSRTSRTCRSALERLRWKQFAGAQNVEYLLRELGARSLNAAPPTVIYIRKLIIRFRPHLPLLSPRYPENWFPGLGALSYIFFLLKPCLVAGAKFLIGESRHLRINGDLIKDYSSTKIKINRVPLTRRREENVSGWRAWGRRMRTFRLAIPFGQQP